MVKLAVGDVQAVCWNDEVFCQECSNPLVPANKVIHHLDWFNTRQARSGHRATRTVKAVSY
eukprot:366954-Prorocentrum_lima.AAC.1